MESENQVRICIDRFLDGERLIEASERAIEENPTNRPAFSFTPGLGIAPLNPFELAALTAKKWDNGRELRVHFMDGDPDVQARLQPFAQQWSEHANIRFQFVNDPDAEIRISFQQQGSWSYLGTDALSIPKNQPTMNFGWLTRNTADDEYSRVVIHEFGHALGCYHEHSNPTADIPWNKEAVYAYYEGPPNNWSRADVDHNLFRRYASGISQFSQFDDKSIMLYSIPERFVTDPARAVGWNQVLSDTDKSFIGTMYPRVVKRATELQVNARSRLESIGEHGEEDLFRFKAAEQGRYRILTSGWTNVVMTLYGPNNDTNLIAMDDDSGFLWNARIVADLDPGDYYVRVRHFRPQGRGYYRIRVKQES